MQVRAAEGDLRNSAVSKPLTWVLTETVAVLLPLLGLVARVLLGPIRTRIKELWDSGGCASSDTSSSREKLFGLSRVPLTGGLLPSLQQA